MKFNLHNKIYLEIAKTITSQLKAIGVEQEIEVSDIYSQISPPPKADMGDLAFPCFSFAKALRKSPAQIGTDLAAAINKGLGENSIIAECKNFGPYANFYLAKEHLASSIIHSVLDETMFETKLIDNAPKTIVEYSQPNTHKVMHVGHMRNLCLGHAIVNLYKYAGINTLSTTFPGDVGTHVAKCLWYYKKHNKEAIPSERKGEWLGQMYVAGNLLLEDQLGTEHEQTNKDELTKILKELHSGEGEYYKLWQETREWSLELMQEVYSWAGVSFDSWYWESDVDADSVKLVNKYFEEGLFIKDEGAIGIDLKEDKLGFCLLLKSDGTGLYTTKDLELARRKFEEQQIEKSLYIVDNRQSLHFKQVFKTLEKMGFEHAKDCIHLQYEMVELTDGAMSSRKGNTVPIQALIDQMTETIITNYLDKYKEEWTTEEIQKTAHIVASGAIKYGMTRIDSNKKIIFEMNDWLKLDGESGPYIQYVHARIQSMLAKIETEVNLETKLKTGDCDFTKLTHKLETAIINKLASFNTIVEQCVEHNKTHPLCSYLYELSKAYNSFYAELSVLKAESEELMVARAQLSKSVATCLKHGLKLLGITAPNKM